MYKTWPKQWFGRGRSRKAWATLPNPNAVALFFFLCCSTYVQPAASHTWLFSRGRSSMQASTSRPYKVRGDSNGGQDTHAQFGPNQHMVVRWASSHNNTFTLAVVAGADQGWFFHKDYYSFVDDYIDSAPPGANEAIVKPRYHGSAGSCGYLNAATNTACAGGYCIKDLFQREVKASDAEYVGHKLDMSPPGRPWTHSMFTYNPDYVHNEEGYANGADWTRIPDRRVAYKSETYPWLVSAMRFHNKVSSAVDASSASFYV